MIDLHSHILPHLDDGARDLDESVAMVRSMADEGVRIVAATPHVRSDYPTTPEEMEDALLLVRDAVARAGIDIEIRGGGEIAVDRFARLDLGTLQRFGLGANPRVLLLEYPYSGWSPDLAAICIQLRRDGIVPVIAHPERNEAIHHDPSTLEALVQVGALVQLTAASVDGRLGRAPAVCARRLLELELAHLIASDAHAPHLRQAGLSKAVDAVGQRALAQWLTDGVPEAILAGADLPARPSVPRRKRRFRRRT